MRRLDHPLASRNQIRQDVMSGTQRHQGGRSIRLRTAGVRLRIPAPRARVRQAGELVMRRLAGRAAVLAGLPILILGLAAGTAAAASAGGQVSNYTGTGIGAPSGITAGPANGRGPGAVVYQPGRYNGNLDRADHPPGQVINYTGPLINDPLGITAGPATTGNRRCGSPTTAATRSGRSVTPPPGRSPTTPAASSAARRRSRSARTGRCGLPTPATTRSGGSPPPGRSPATPAPASMTRPPSRPARTGRCGSPTPKTTRSGRSPPPGRSPTYTGSGYTGAWYINGPSGITAGPDGALWFTNNGDGPYGTGSIGRMTTSGTLTTSSGQHQRRQPGGDRDRPGRGAVVHQQRQRQR